MALGVGKSEFGLEEVTLILAFRAGGNGALWTERSCSTNNLRFLK